MNSAAKKSSFYQQLRDLADRPDERAYFAAQMLKKRLDNQELLSALQVLVDKPNPSAREDLIRLFNHFAQDGEVRDAGAKTRSWLIRALRPISSPPDDPVFERAALTYEFLPPHFREEAGPLRAAGIVALSETNGELAAYHASRILMERYTDPMSGEPALTAARVLASLGQHTLLYQYLYQDNSQAYPEVTSECLRYLTSVPLSLVPGLLERFSVSDNDLILAGLFDLLIGHESGPLGKDYLFTFIEGSKRYDAYRYLMALVVSASRQELLPLFLPQFRLEKDERKAFILIDALDPLAHDPDIAEVIRELRQVNNQ